MRLARLPVLLAALAAAGPALAQGYWDPRPHHGGQATLGVGLLLASVSGGPRAVDGASGAGLQILLDYRLTERLACDLRLGGFWPSLAAPEEISYPADDGDYSLLFTGLHYDVVSRAGGAFWVGLEVAVHYAQMEHYAYALGGLGVGPALGADLALRGPFALRFGAHLSWVSLESGQGEGFGTSVVFAGTADLLYVFQ
jgi:hypothetical protein